MRTGGRQLSDCFDKQGRQLGLSWNGERRGKLFKACLDLEQDWTYKPKAMGVERTWSVDQKFEDVKVGAFVILEFQCHLVNWQSLCKHPFVQPSGLTGRYLYT